VLRDGAIAYERHGGGAEAAKRPPLLLIHGAAGSRLFWPPALRHLTGVEVYAIDLPGHGASGGDERSTIEGYATEVGKWMENVGLRSAVCAGHSMGSAIALTLALEKPGTVVGLILVGGAPSLRVNRKLLELSASVTTAREAVDLIVRWSFGPKAPARLVELARRRMADVSARVLHNDFQACDEFDLRSELSRIAAPVLALCGAEDRMTPPDQSRALVEGIRRARLVLIEGAGHMVMLEQPEPVTQAFASFLSDTFPPA
jgi:pimeloyl-ACP methyl ester carboxylesterase